nr:hypothetical protein [Tanacetum cinerariifolium]
MISTKELFTPFKDPEQEFCSSRKLFKTLSLDELRSPKFNLFFDLEENSEPKIDDKDHFELKGHLNDYYCDEKKGSYEPQFLDAYSYGATRIDDSLPQKEKDLGSFTLPCYIDNVCFKYALAEVGASVSVMLSHTVIVSVSHIVGLDLSKLAIILNRPKKIYFKGLTSGIRPSRELWIRRTKRMARDDNHDGDHPETSNTTPPVPSPTQQIPHTVLSIKLPILKKGKYDIWAMKMEHYLNHIDYPIWQVIQNGNGLVSVTTYTNDMIKVLPPKTAEEVVAREKERKARTTLLMALPEDHLAKFHKMADAKKMWEAIKSRFGGNDESKKMQKYLLKQQFEGFSVSTSEGLHKEYDRFQTLLSQLEIHGAGVSHEDANHKFLRSLPSSWSQASLIMRTKPGLDTLSFDDLYNNLRVFERDVKGTTASSSNTHNVAFVSADNTSSTNDVSTAYSVSSLSVLKSQKEGSLSYTNEVIQSFFANQSSAPQLDYDDLEQINNDDMEDMDLKWNQDSRKRDVGYNGNKTRDNGRRPAYQDDSKALVTIDGDDIDWSGHVEEDAQNHAMMAYSSSNSGSDNKASDLEDTPVNDRYADEMHAVPPHMTGNYMPSGPNVEIDYFKFTYGPKQTLVDESDSKPSEYASCESDSSVETTTSMPQPVEKASKVVCEPKVWNDTPIIEEYESDSDNDSVFNVQEDKKKPSFAFTDSVKHVKTSRKNVKETITPNHSPKIKKQERNGHTKKGLGYSFTRKACFVCGSFRHLIRDCDFHEKRMAKQAELIKSKNRVTGQRENRPVALKDKGIVDSGCSRHMTGNKAYLANYQEFKGGSVAFGGSNGRITGKEKKKTGKLDFEDVYFMEELKHYNLFYVSQMCDEKNKVLSTDTDCLVLSSDFKLPDENQVLLKIPRQHNMYSFNLKNIDPSRDLACLFVKASIDESNKWNKRLGHVNFKNLNRLVKGNLVRGLPSKIFENDYTCIACQKGKQHKASWIKREYSNARTLQQNGVAERKNMTLIEAARTMLADSFLPTIFWAEAINTACYVLNRVLVTKPQNKTPYELLTVENQANNSAGPKEANNSVGTQANDDQGANSEEIDLHEEHFVLPIWSAYSTTVKSSGDKIENNTDSRHEKKANDAAESLRKEATHDIQNANTSSTNLLNTVSTPLSVAGPSRAFNDGESSYPDDPSMPHLEDIYASPSKGIFTDSSYDDEGVVTNFNNLKTTMNACPTPTTRIHTIHPKAQILRDPMSAFQTRSKVNKNSKAHARLCS